MILKTSRPHLFCFAIVCALVLSACATQITSNQIERIVVFGDSNVDTGNLAKLFGDADPRTNVWKGRNSNGPLVSEYLAESLGAELVTYAVSGATTGNANIVSLLAPQLTALANTGMASQITEFENDGETFGQHDLVILWAGSNDIFRADRSNTDELNRRINGATDNLIFAIDKVTKLGAKRVVIATRTPRSVLDSDDDLNGQDLNQALMHGIQAKAANANNDLVMFDAYTVIKQIVLRPKPYGFTKLVELCIEDLQCTSEKYENGLNVANTYLNWDAAHKTTRLHEILAEKLSAVLAD